MPSLERFEYVFLGGGKGGKTLAMDLARSGKRVALIERGMVGGSCINVACIPSKALIQSARTMHTLRSERITGASERRTTVDMALVYRRVRSVVDGMVDINMSAFAAAGFDFILGTGRFVAPRRVQVATNDGHERVVEGVTHFGCLAHARRAFVDALKGHRTGCVSSIACRCSRPSRHGWTSNREGRRVEYAVAL
jgi:pyruvate/2-oxoglutarate dehydrogenase complex dihydrolipoamide dehydrogenase (E3) component